MDSNSKQFIPSRSQIKNLIDLKKEALRNSTRKEEIEKRINHTRQQFMYDSEKIYLKQLELKKEEITLLFNSKIEEAFEYYLTNSFNKALDILVELEPKIVVLEEIPNEFAFDKFTNFFKQVGAELMTNSPLDNKLIFISLDQINLALFKNEQTILEPELRNKTLELLAEEKHHYAENFLILLHQKNQIWLNAVLRQRLVQMDPKLFDLVLQSLGNETVWLILMPLQRIPYYERLFQSILNHKSDKKAFAILKKTLGYEDYLQKFLQANIFFSFTQVLSSASAEDKKYFLNEIIECVLSICCLKFELFAKFITSGLAVVISAQPVSELTFDGVMNLQRIVYWMQNENSGLLRQQLQDSVWFQNFYLLLLQQDQNMAAQQHTLEMLRYQLQSDKASYFRDFFKQSLNLPDNIKSQIDRFL